MRKNILFIVWMLPLFMAAQQASTDFAYVKQHLTDPGNEVVLVAAHRAMHTRYPENSLAAITDAIAHGVDIVEVDVRVSKDGIPVLMHNETVDHISTGSGKVKKICLSELKTFRLRDDRGKITRHSIPTLEEALNLGKDKIVFDIDLKVNTRDLKKVTAVVKKCDAINSVFFYDSEYDKIQRVERLLPGVLRMTKIHHDSKAKKHLEMLLPDIVHLGNSAVDREVGFIETVQRDYRLPVFANALGETDEAARDDIRAYDILLDRKVNIIQTDTPVLLLQYLRQKNKHR
ncbi:glycerophosphodiester phosphodiesterase family protein [Sinomicrobium soli]|uniref:glycerophosphodiester phosphodiesterase family protein n=1 Tax=Sinomicrobium sp. N-1-3-6 TaxID=2219864 RepID=UPI001374CDF1|nr:glycerophosphodiester phosphodiesterase family protein [Sinomicrobium sp. N-1-3-6]